MQLGKGIEYFIAGFSLITKKGLKRFIPDAYTSWGFTRNGFVVLVGQLREFIRFG